MIISNFAPMVDSCWPTTLERCGLTTQISKYTGENTTYHSFVLITRILFSVAFVGQKLAKGSSTQSFPTLTCHFYCPDNF